jgi:hypothetical protein
MHSGKLEIKFDLTQKKSPFLMTFLFAPLTDERCSYNEMIEYVTIRKLNG